MKCLAFLLLSLAALEPLGAQDISATRIYTEPAGVKFSVDGKVYWTGASFLWPAGTKHLLMIEPLQFQPGEGSRYTFSSWSDGSGKVSVSSPALEIIADPSITSYKATLNLEHSITLRFNPCVSPSGQACLSSGTVSVGETP